MFIKFNNLEKQWRQVEHNCNKRIASLHQKSSYVLGEDVSLFEEAFASFVGVKYAIGVSSGLDALKIALKSLEKKNPVIFIPANTFIATVISAELAYPQAKIVLVDCDQSFQICVKDLEKKIKNNSSNKEKIIIPVHLYGCTVDGLEVERIAAQYKCDIVEDASQSHGSHFENGKLTGSLGRCAAFSLYPGKNLGAAGDAGVIVTKEKALRDKMLLLRNYGSIIKYKHECKGYNNRLDSMQAIIVHEKLAHLAEWNLRRNEIANIYINNIKNKSIKLPVIPDYCGFHTFHVFPVLCEDRDFLQKYLTKKKVQTGIHYPVPIEMTTAYRKFRCKNKNTRHFSETILSLPIHPFMDDKEALHVCALINEFNEKNR